MGLVQLTLLCVLLGSPLLALLAWHAWRDKRGEKRNKAGYCYSCGCTLNGRAKPISHHKGGTYMYCHSCATFHTWVKNSFLLVALVLIAAFLVVMFISTRTG